MKVNPEGGEKVRREDTDSSTRFFRPWQRQWTNQRVRFQNRCCFCRENANNVPAIAEDNDLEQGSSTQRHSCLRWGCGCNVLDGSFAALMRDLIGESTANIKGKKRLHFRSLSALFLYSTDFTRNKKG